MRQGLTPKSSWALEGEAPWSRYCWAVLCLSPAGSGGMCSGQGDGAEACGMTLGWAIFERCAGGSGGRRVRRHEG